MGWYVYVIAASLALALFFFLNRDVHRRPLPPGPQGGYFAGVRDQLPSTEPWKTYAAWSTQFTSEYLPITFVDIYLKSSMSSTLHK